MRLTPRRDRRKMQSVAVASTSQISNLKEEWMLHSWRILTMIFCLAASPAVADIPAGTVSQTFAPPTPYQRAPHHDSSPRVLKFLWGKDAVPGIYYVPYNSHASTNYTDLHPSNLIGIIRGRYSFGTFNNSFNDRTVFAGLTRDIALGRRFGIEYSFGLMVGYQGKLAGSFGSGPLRFLQPLFQGNLNPYVTVGPYYRLTERLDVSLNWSLAFVSLGFKYRF